ncbi:MAG TPA: endonuclease Q family protein [Patescibacteria group bacterium]|nr:endonuclease Q family protein [Patescibacteria group bacterium]
MEVVADLHLHSKYSRAVSQNMILPTMANYALQKGLDLLSASDWTHPLWLKEIQLQLEESSEGLYRLKNVDDNRKKIQFILSVEIASIYKQGEKLRRIHNLVFVPNFAVAEKVNKELIRRGCNLNADGRPIIGISSKDLLSLLLAVDERILLIPAHIWTPHFGIYGSASGFDSLEEAFGDMAKYIYGIETGLSSDPDMNWQVDELNSRSILSFSDAHSPAKMGRELTVFVSKNSANGKEQIAESITYEDIRLAIMNDEKSKLRVGYTVEFYPEEGKYHFSGHRNCQVVFGPEDIKEKGTTCPVCGRRLTEGVLLRVNQLASSTIVQTEEKLNSYGLKWYTHLKKKHPPYVKMVPLLEIIAESLKVPVTSPKAIGLFSKLCTDVASEIQILLKTPTGEIAAVAGEKVADGIARVRSGNITVLPGYDGEFGKVKIWEEEKAEEAVVPQLSLDI